MKLIPSSLATRTALTMLGALMLVQAIGLTVHALDRVELQRLAQTRDIVGKQTAYPVKEAQADRKARGG